MGRLLLNIKLMFLLVAIVVALTGVPGPSQVWAQDGYVEDECAECHDDMAEDHKASLHGNLPCLDCHAQAVKIDHEELPPVDCRQCHAPHDEKTIHDAHIRVSCKTCHQKSGVSAISRDLRLSWFDPVQPHQVIAKSECQTCHFQGNRLGAAAMILPPKSVLCMPCHAATFSIGDATTLVSLAVFLLGMVSVAGLWFSAIGVKGGHLRLSGDCRRLAVEIIAEVLFLKRLFRLSPARWAIHGLICYPILLRLIFGLAALLLSLALPDAGLTRAMIDKNYPLTSLFFDMTGLMILGGVLVAVLRAPEDRQPVAGTPTPGRAMTVLLGIVIFAGFILEGVRIAMTGWPSGAGWAFAGYGLSLLLTGMEELTDIYGYLWHAHAVLTGAFIALIPFTRMLHIFTAPLSLAIDMLSNQNDKG